MWRRHSCLRVAEGDLIADHSDVPLVIPGDRRGPDIGVSCSEAALRAARRQEYLRHTYVVMPHARSVATGARASNSSNVAAARSSTPVPRGM